MKLNLNFNILKGQFGLFMGKFICNNIISNKGSLFKKQQKESVY